jgi:hypothetical protein
VLTAGEVLVCVAVGTEEDVAMKVDVNVGGNVDVGGRGVKEAVKVGKGGVIVTPGMGVNVDLFGTQSNCPV